MIQRYIECGGACNAQKDLRYTHLLLCQLKLVCPSGFRVFNLQVAIFEMF